MFIVCKSYSWCQECGDFVTEPKSEIQPLFKSSVMCVKCQTTITMGKRLTFTPRFMFENPDDENKPIRLGEPSSLSPKRWYWHCSACGHREEMRKSDLRRTYEEHSFVISQPGKKKPTMNKEDVEDIKAGLGGTPTSLIDERDFPAPGY